MADDITKAFLQISVTPDDRDVLRFLWWSKSKPRKMVVYRHRHVVFGVNSSPFLLGATIEHHLNASLETVESQKEADFIKKLRKSFYVDNCVTSVVTEEERLQFQQNSVEVMRRAGFELRGWEFTGTDVEKDTSSILGISWDKHKDLLFICLNFPDKLARPITKRKILSAAHKIFDPLGWACPAVLLPKLMLQDLWNQDLGWDTDVPEQIASKFERWFEQIPMLQELKVPRWIFGLESDALTLHMFVDASKYAYAAALFVRVETSQRVEVNLVQAKSRVGPASETSIPRMELLAATLGARLMASVLKAVNFSGAEIIFWSDSSTVLSWLRQRRQWTRFVWNRVEEVRKLTDVQSWRHVPGTLNPADLPSRGCAVSQLIQSRWWEGPNWLAHPRADWPQEECSIDDEQVNFEICKNRRKITPSNQRFPDDARTTVTCANATQKSENILESLLKISSYKRIVRTTGWLLRFVKNARIAKDLRVKREELSVEECDLAEKTLIKLVQAESFHEIGDQRLKGLNVYLDELGLIRTKTLVSNRLDNFGFKYPAVLDPDHSFTRLLIENTHIHLKHAGFNTTMAALR